MNYSADVNRAALEWFARRADPAALLVGRWEPPTWPQGREAVTRLLHLDRADHFLRHPPGVLPQLWERQVTQGLQALLLNTPSRTLERCQALFDAVAGANKCQLSAIEDIKADDTTRMDLAIYARLLDGTGCCLVLEAKLEAPLSDKQLSNYRRLVRKRYAKRAQRHLWVVAPKLSAGVAKVLGRSENAEWQFITWRRLLLNWQYALPLNPGADVTSFFGEIWKRVGGR